MPAKLSRPVEQLQCLRSRRNYAERHLRAERDRIVRAIEALLGIASSSPVTKKRAGGARATGRRRCGITLEGRRRLSLAMKKRWAERKKKGK